MIKQKLCDDNNNHRNRHTVEKQDIETYMMNPTISQSSTSSHNNNDDYDDEDVSSFLPECLMLEILVRLPVKDVFKFKCVSKEWLSTIGDPGFPRFYASHESSASTTAWAMVGSDQYFTKDTYTQYEEILTHNYVGNSSSASLILQYFFSTFKDKYCILGSSYGLLLCWTVKEEKYYVCNPLTRKSVALPPIPNKPKMFKIHKHRIRQFVIFDTKVESGMVTEYKVVDLEIYRMLKLWIFCSKTGEWTRRKVPCPKELFHSQAMFEAIVVNGILYASDGYKGVITYDLNSNKDDQNCQYIPLPTMDRSWNDILENSLANMISCQGEFKYIYTHGSDLRAGQSLEIWSLKDHHDSGPGDHDQYWKLEHNVRLSNYIKAADGYPALMDDQNVPSHVDITSVPLYFDPFDINSVYLGFHVYFLDEGSRFNISGIAVCDLHTGKLEEICRQKQCIIADTKVPFFIPPWPTPIPQPLPS